MDNPTHEYARALRCPHCTQVLSLATSVIDDPNPPKDGDVSVCFTCLKPSEFKFRDDGQLLMSPLGKVPEDMAHLLPEIEKHAAMMKKGSWQ